MLDCAALFIGVHGRCFHGCFQKGLDVHLHLDDPRREQAQRPAPPKVAISNPVNFGANA